MKRHLNRQWALAITLLALLLPLILLGWYVAQKHHSAQSQITQVAPRHARLLGMQQHADDLDTALTQARALLGQYAYASSQDVSQAGNDAQQRIRSIFTAAGLDIVSSQVLAPKPDTPFDRIPLTVRAEGQLLTLQTALIGLENQTPAILIEGFSVNTIGAVKAETPQRLAILFNLSVLREQP